MQESKMVENLPKYAQEARDFLSPLSDPKKFKVIAKPEGKGKGFWAGGCSCLKDAKGKIWLAYRLRDPEKRGHRLCIALSSNGLNFQPIKYLDKKDFASIQSLERSSLLQDPDTGKYKLYVSLEKEKKWYIYKLKDVSSPKGFDPSTAKLVFSPSSEANDSRKVKDPYIINFGNIWYMFYSGSGEEPQEEAFLATSKNGVDWVRRGCILQRNTWHNYHSRMSCVLPLGKGFIFLYEGSSFSWYEPHFNLNIGFGYTADLKNFLDLTSEKPLLSSSGKGDFSTIRYVDYVFFNDKIVFYYEAARDDNSFELRAVRINPLLGCIRNHRRKRGENYITFDVGSGSIPLR